MRMLRSEIHFVDGDEEVLLLLGIDELDGTLLHQVLKGHLVVADVLDILLGNLGSAIPDHDQGRRALPRSVWMMTSLLKSL